MMKIRWDIRIAMAAILFAGLLILPACGSEGVREAQAARSDAGAQDAQQPAADQDDQDLATEPEAEPEPEQKPAPAPAAPARPAPAAPAQPAPTRTARATTPAPTAVRLTVEPDTQIEVEMLTPISSETSQPGDPFTARVTRDVMVGNHVAIPAGAEASGTVTEAVATKKIGGQARLTIQFDTLSFSNGQRGPFAATLTTEGKKQTAKDTGTIAGSTAGGALLGRVLAKDKQKGTAIGAVVGAAAGTAIAANNASDPVNFAEGTIVPLTIQEPIFVLIEGNSRRFASR